MKWNVFLKKRHTKCVLLCFSHSFFYCSIAFCKCNLYFISVLLLNKTGKTQFSLLHGVFVAARLSNNNNSSSNNDLKTKRLNRRARTQMENRLQFWFGELQNGDSMLGKWHNVPDCTYKRCTNARRIFK